MRALLRVMAVLTSILCISVTAYAATGSVTITYNNGGSIQVLSQVKTEGNVVYVDDDNPVEFKVVPNSGYTIKGVYMNNQSLNISGTEAKTVSIAPKGTDVQVRATFIKTDVAENLPPTKQDPEPQPEPDTPSQPEAPATTDPKPETPSKEKPEQKPIEEAPSSQTPSKTEEPSQGEKSQDETQPSDNEQAQNEKPTGAPIEPPKGGDAASIIGEYDIDNPGIGGLAEQNDSGSARVVRMFAAIAGAAAIAVCAMMYVIKKRS